MNPTLIVGLEQLGRAGVASLFILAGLNKLMQYSMVSERMQDNGLVPVAVLLPLTIALELGAGIVIASGKGPVAYAALALAVFTVATNLVFHRFWELAGQHHQLELSLFFKNISIAGALLMIAAQNWPYVALAEPAE